MKITDVTGPYREPREQVFSYDYSIQRASWPTAQAVRVKVAIPEELDVLRSKILGAVAGTPGQQLMISKFLSRHIADEKIRIAETDGMLTERRDTVVAPFTGPLVHLFPRLDAWAGEQRETLRAEIKKWLDCSHDSSRLLKKAVSKAAADEKNRRRSPLGLR